MRFSTLVFWVSVAAIVFVTFVNALAFYQNYASWDEVNGTEWGVCYQRCSEAGLGAPTGFRPCVCRAGSGVGVPVNGSLYDLNSS